MIYITLSSEGVPTYAVCEDCRATWYQPPGDRAGMSFRGWVREHLRTGQRHSEMWLVGIHKT